MRYLDLQRISLAQAKAKIKSLLADRRTPAVVKRKLRKEPSRWEMVLYDAILAQLERSSLAPSRFANPQFSSADTSRKQVPAVIKRIDWERGAVNLDIGGGRFDDTTRWLRRKGVTNLVFDPFNRPPMENIESLEKVYKRGGADTVTVANVLNVIKDREERRGVVERAAENIVPRGVAFFAVYEGNKSGKGKRTGPDQWQNNKRAEAYMPEVRQYFKDVQRKGSFIIAKGPKKAL